MSKQVSYKKYKQVKDNCDWWKGEYDKSKKYKRGLVGWRIAFFVVLFVSVEIVLINLALAYHVDENQFCLDKLNRWYSEYDWKYAVYERDNSVCEGTYYLPTNNTVSNRDHLEEVLERDTAEKKFYLTSEEEVKYLARDDMTECPWIIFLIISGLLFI